MKRIFKYMLLAVLSAVSCGKEPVVQHGDEEISFAAPSIAETKSVLIKDKSGMVSADGQLAYGVFASRYIPGPGGSITSHEQFMDDVKVYSTDGGSNWQYSGNYYWSPGAAYKFFAVYPWYNRDADTYDLGISYSINEAKHALQVTGKHGNDKIICTGHNGQELCPDILYGVKTYPDPYQVGERREPVNFAMHHAFAAVSFDIRNASVYNITNIETALITGFHNASEYVLLSENGAEWATPQTVEGDDHKFKVADYTGTISPGENYTIPAEDGHWCTMLMIPQNFGAYQQSPQFIFTVTMAGEGNGAKQYTINFKDYTVNSVAEHAYTYLPGYHYVYTFNVTAKNISCDVEIVPWIEDEYIELN